MNADIPAAAATTFRFDRFRLDLAERQLSRDGAPVELNSRYFDALALLVRAAGSLVSKDRFMDEVWRGVPVTDEALTQCVRTLRRQLGDDASRPRFIETVPKHGYRFIAPVAPGDDEAVLDAASPALTGKAPSPWRGLLPVWFGGTVGGGVAGALGGIFYGFAVASERPGAGSAAVSMLLVLTLITAGLALVGALAVGFGVAAGARGRERPGWQAVAGGALGGFLVGAMVKLLGLDAFSLLFGRSPGDITGAPEGALLGAAVGLAAWVACRASPLSPRRGAALGAVCGGAAGAAIALAGGRLLGGSLQLLATAFPQSRLRLDQIGALLGEPGFGPLSHLVTSALEGALFAACVVAGMLVARRAASYQPGSNRHPVGR